MRRLTLVLITAVSLAGTGCAGQSADGLASPQIVPR